LHVETDYGGQAAYDAQAWQGGQPGFGTQQGFGGEPGYTVSPDPRRGRGIRAGSAAAVAILLLSVTGLGVSLAGIATQMLPRQFTAHQRQQIVDWETAKRWREWPAGKIFPASVRYPAPAEVGGAMTLTARRIGIARQASCQAATDVPVAVVLMRNGCQAMLRATYADWTDSYVVTVGVATFQGSAAAGQAHHQLTGPALTSTSGAGEALGVRPVRFAHTPAAWFYNDRRQISGNATEGTYVVFYAIGYADNRKRQPVSSDSYAYSEMLSLGTGVAQDVMSTLAKPPQPPHCPGTPGC
jgi:hypothetical protein